MSNRKTRIFVGLVIILLIASLTLMTMPNNTVQAAVTQIGTSPTTVSGYPNLNPKPEGVTPDYSFPTTAFLSFRPNPIGVGQLLLVNIWTTPGVYHAFYMCDYKVTIQKPDGTTETAGPFNSYLADATAWFEYIPDQVGTYRLKFEQPGTYIPAGNYTDSPGQTVGRGTRALPGNIFPQWKSFWYMPSETDWQNLTVQADLVPSWPASPLPTDYWTRPISPENREWWSIAGNYPWRGAYYYANGRVLYASNYRYTAYVQAPNTAHVVWRQQGTSAGLIGGTAYQYSISANAGTPSIIYNGRCYQTVTKVVDGQTISVWQCYDLRTGEVYWERTGVPAATNIEYAAPGADVVPGAEASGSYSINLVVISGGRLIKYNPFTGAAVANISLPSGITSATIYNDPWALTVQTVNASAPLELRSRLINWSITGTNTNFTTRIGSNITWPMTSLGTVDYEFGIAVTASTNSPSYGLYGGMEWFGPQVCIGYTIQAVDLRTGTNLYIINSTDTLTFNVQSGSSLVVKGGRIALNAHNMHWNCWDARTGQVLWTSGHTGYPWGNWWAYNTASYDFNESKSAIIGSAYDGIYAIDWADGKILWHYSVPSVPFEDPYETAPFFTGVQIADGKVYAYSGDPL